MPRMLAVSDEVRAEIGDDEADRLLAGAHAPDTYDCTSCRTPGDSSQEATSTVLFVGDETAVLAFAHARCIPSQVVPVSEEQLLGAVRSISQAQGSAPAAAGLPGAGVGADPEAASQAEQSAPPAAGQPAVLGITCGLVLCGDTGHAALVVEPTGPVGRPGNITGEDEFLSLLTDHHFQEVMNVDKAPESPLPGWSVLMAMGKLHAILQPSATGGSSAWWQAHQPLQVTDAWRLAAGRQASVTMYAVPAGTIGRQPREDLLRLALDRAAAKGLLVGAILPLAGT
ncbi:hypothetical protein [Saccharothrix sp. ST-888]|uniref:hypothetical protein n=1 Tax=Saccharothrix sp. ST-888 TaxID=1427391 RepID=UPI0005EC2EF1|nr:hypothetical protein [Saccharothrix sp. ST-888]KJK58619.1 hypothetical protein UK12_09155 [Saccharothrix sp. ST-888]